MSIGPPARDHGNEDHRHAALGLFGKQKIGDLFARVGIEVAGRFIGYQYGWRRGECAGDGHTLLLAAGKLAGIMIEALAETDSDQFTLGDFERVRNVCQFQRHCDIFQCGHVGDEVEGLKNDANVAAAEIRERVLTELVQRRIRNDDFAAVEPLEPGKHHQKCRLSRSGGADDANRLALSD